MIAVLNLAVDDVESHLVTDPSAPVDASGTATRTGTTEHHLRRMFASLAGMPLSEYVRRRRMSLAASDLVTTNDDLLTIAVRYGYGSTEAFGRAFRAVHGVGPSDARRDGGPLRTQPRIRFHLTVEGSVPMDTRITSLPAVRLIGYAKRVPLIHEGINAHIAEHVASIAVEEVKRLKSLNDTEPSGVLAVSDDLDPDRTEGSELTYLHGVATTAAAPEGLDVIQVPAGDVGSLPNRGSAPASPAGRLGSDLGHLVPVAAVAAAPRTRDRRHPRLRCRSRDRHLRALATRRARIGRRDGAAEDSSSPMWR
ncbi:helix-turn-helix domain-containing protein [Nocardioides sp. cx-173]|uniref:AraC family transcriptional regulator n=1 Tax=Nocardioides sp. cx-173 TaxID=2898796 RepID=UPI001E3472D9|nr:helix-turn-helix domain-containing protein [Nocardioides sp. cx-173]UGB40112.1 helix-turn-helix domain-containing protein [Nocardioides sp. cx-173]